ncbi:hypothetical protein HPB52_021340 [Rhipicephalus sanguineus]|uniref:Uncharacterized protein n=1 Tax=Rhipicephalus sanguineus TaxID=34632 RepID=A0A9D4PFD4_RHISA|nr:hypothetical protein HPB52_021340 [Rhipicephalus sanguineus]
MDAGEEIENEAAAVKVISGSTDTPNPARDVCAQTKASRKAAAAVESKLDGTDGTEAETKDVVAPGPWAAGKVVKTTEKATAKKEPVGSLREKELASPTRETHLTVPSGKHEPGGALRESEKMGAGPVEATKTATDATASEAVKKAPTTMRATSSSRVTSPARPRTVTKAKDDAVQGGENNRQRAFLSQGGNVWESRALPADHDTCCAVEETGPGLVPVWSPYEAALGHQEPAPKGLLPLPDERPSCV